MEPAAYDLIPRFSGWESLNSLERLGSWCGMLSTSMGTATSATPAKEVSAGQSHRIRLLIADDSQMGCYLLKAAITRSRFGFHVIACATTRSEILDSLNKHQVDVALVSADLVDGPLAGFEAVREVRAAFPKTPVVLILKSPPDEMIVAAFRSGAKGVFCRQDPLPGLWKCIRSVHQGQIWANTKQLRLILEAFISAMPIRAVSAQGRYLLTKREDDVVNLVAEGLTNKAIAKHLHISQHTVSNYLFKIYEKLGISSRTELVLYIMSRRHGQTPPTT